MKQTGALRNSWKQLRPALLFVADVLYIRSVLYILKEKETAMERQTDLTRGNIGPQLAALAIPLLGGNILQQLYNTVDSLIIGKFVGAEAFAAVGVAGTVMNLFIFILTGCCIGVSVIFAQLYGQKNMAAFRRECYLAVVFGGGFTIGFSILAAALLPYLLPLIQTPEEVAPYVSTYLGIIFAGLIATYFYNLSSTLLRAVGNTRAALLFLAVAVCANTVLDVVFVAGLRTGIGGAAFATVISQILSVVLCAGYLMKKYPELLFRKEDMRFDGKLLKKTFDYGIVSALQQSSLYIGKLLVQGAVNSLGTYAIAAYTATMRIEGVANSFSDSGGQSISVFIAQNRGAGNRERAKQGFFTGLRMMHILSLVLSVLMFAGAVPGIRFFVGSQNAEEIAAGASYLRVVAVFYILCFTGSSFVGLFRGVGMIPATFVGSTLQIAIRAALSYLLVKQLGLSAVAFATGAGWMAIVAYQIFIYMTRVRKQVFTES